MLPAPTRRLRFREMTPDGLDEMADLPGDPTVMAFYSAPKSRTEASVWIDWNQRNYAEYGYGFWVLETLEGEFVGDCGLTWQRVNGVATLEVGYHVRSAHQGLGYASEAAAACRDFAREALGAGELVAIIHPENHASRRVAEKIGMVHVDDIDPGHDGARTVLGMDLTSRWS
ncbi:GNAT family N-acetyltransferase [Ruania halotolerans]|uniref:GNAT family N-acetyltransferase n=1 Tax=Ruania halotolerans TaxID=2897773 RepID=UPI001E4B67D1|nr:GNAT family N-acetyltransferase [Ruania halotolerans]UFU08252.1 GNAT family N-acetyltransferase [Ruania halotolerans]